jgi:hypothetical protein
MRWLPPRHNGSPKQRIADAIYKGTLGKPCVYVIRDANGYHDGTPAPIGQQESQSTEQNLTQPVFETVEMMRDSTIDYFFAMFRST